MNDLILLHAALGSKAQLAELKSLLAQSHTVHSLNFEGHGGRPCDGSFSMELFAENVLGFMQQNAISKADFFGYSMGGYVALHIARHRPEVVGRILTLGTKLEWTEESFQQQKRMLNPEKIEAKVPAFAEMLQRTHAPCDWKTVLTKTADMMQQLAAGHGLHEEDFKAIAHEVLITVGDKDQMVTAEESQQVAQWLPNATFRSLEGVEHAIEKTDQKHLAEQILAFLSQK